MVCPTSPPPFIRGTGHCKLCPPCNTCCGDVTLTYECGGCPPWEACCDAQCLFVATLEDSANWDECTDPGECCFGCTLINGTWALPYSWDDLGSLDTRCSFGSHPFSDLDNGQPDGVEYFPGCVCTAGCEPEGSFTETGFTFTIDFLPGNSYLGGEEDPCTRDILLTLWMTFEISGSPGATQIAYWYISGTSTTDGCGEWTLALDTAATIGYDEGNACNYPLTAHLECITCPVCDPESQWPVSWQVDIAGLSDGLLCSSCAGLNQTYFLDGPPVINSVPLQVCGLTEPMSGPCTIFSYSVSVRLTLSGDYILQFAISGVSDDLVWEYNFGPTAPECDSFTDLELSPVGSSDLCINAGSTATLTVTAPPP